MHCLAHFFFQKANHLKKQIPTVTSFPDALTKFHVANATPFNAYINVYDVAG